MCKYGFLFNGQDPAFPEGNQIPFPSNDDFRNDRGDGHNVFGHSLNETVHGVLPHGFYDETITWGNLSDEDCQHLRDMFSVYKNAGGLLELFDYLSSIYLGTTGNSYGSYDEEQGCYTAGIFTGAKTSANHEIWERILELTQCYYRDVYGLEESMNVWSKPGSARSQCSFEQDGRRYYDSALTIPYNYQAKMPSSIYTDEYGNQKSRSWNDVLREYGYTSTHDSLYPSKEDGIPETAMRRQFIYNAGYSRLDAIVFPTDLTSVYYEIGNAYPEEFFHTDNKALEMYQDKSSFYSCIESIRHESANGIIHGEVIDSVGTFSEKTFLTGLLDYCRAAGIEVITKSEAYDICFYQGSDEGNLLYNPNLRNTAEEFFGNEEGIPTNPDGYTGNCHVEETKQGNRVLVTDGETVYCHFGIPTGTIEFKFKGKGNGTVTIYAVQNKDVIDDINELDVLAEINVDSSKFKTYSDVFEIMDYSLNEKDNLYDGCADKVTAIKIIYSEGLSVSDIHLEQT